MENIANLMSSLTDEQVAEYCLPKYPPSVQDWARQEVEARIARRQLAQEAIANQIVEETAREARKATIAKIARSLEKVWTDDLTNVLITREEVDDLANGKEVEVVTEIGKPPVKEMRYPKVKALVVRTNVFWFESKQVNPTKSGNTKGETVVAKKRAVTVTLEGKFIQNAENGEQACKNLGYNTAGDSGNRVLREGRSNNPHYFAVKPYEGKDYTDADTAKANLANAPK